MWLAQSLTKLSRRRRKLREHADLVLGPKRAVQQAEGVQLLQPLAVGDIAFAARQILHVAGVDQFDLQAPPLQDLKERDPIDAGGLHDHRVDALFEEPIGQAVQVTGKGAKLAHRGLGAIGREGHPMEIGPDVDAGGVEVDAFQNGVVDPGWVFAPFRKLFGHIGCGTVQGEAQRLGPRGS
jgi:hypothetical protein